MADIATTESADQDAGDLKGRTVYLLCGSDIYADRGEAEKAAGQMLLREWTEGPMRVGGDFLGSLMLSLQHQGFEVAARLWDMHLRANAGRHRETRDCGVSIQEETIR